MIDKVIEFCILDEHFEWCHVMVTENCIRTVDSGVFLTWDDLLGKIEENTLEQRVSIPKAHVSGLKLFFEDGMKVGPLTQNPAWSIYIYSSNGIAAHIRFPENKGDAAKDLFRTIDRWINS